VEGVLLLMILIFAAIMGRIICIDYGSKKCGFAATDPLQIAVFGIGTFDTNEFVSYLVEYCEKEDVEMAIIGDPFTEKIFDKKLKQKLSKFVNEVKSKLPGIAVKYHDESFSSERAKQVLLKSGVRRKKRRDKRLIDKISAVLILQDYLQHI
jgi:putative Holliday junction resolvase